MNKPMHSHQRIASLMLGFCLLSFSYELLAANYPWRFTIKPPNSVYLAVSVGMDYQGITTSRSLSVPAGAAVQIYPSPLSGYVIQKVTDNGVDVTSAAASGFNFTNVSAAHTFVFTLVAGAPPTGTFNFVFPASLPSGVAPIYYLTGHYQGILASAQNRTFSADVAMDESGNIDIENVDVQGVAYQPGGLTMAGKMQTVNDKPQLSVSGAFSGTLDDRTLTAKGRGASVVEIHDIGSGVDGIEVSGQAAGKYDGTPYKESNQAFPLPVSTPPVQDWSVSVVLAQKADPRGRQKVYASAQLNLPDGQIVNFAERTVRYSAKFGYTLRFRNGTNATSNLMDRKTKLTISKMLFDTSGAEPVLVGGTLTYAFLGQHGKGNLTDFAPPP